MEKRKTVVLLLSLCSVVMLFNIYMSLKGYIFYSERPNIYSINTGQNNFVKRKFNYSSDILNVKRCFRLLWDFPKNGLRLDNLITDRCKRVVTIAGSRGRTGNDMFQIAAIFGLAYRYDLIPLVPLSFPLLKYFDLPNVVNITSGTLYNSISCRITDVAIYSDFSIKFDLVSNFTMDGNFQSWRYFEREKNIIRRILHLKSKHVMNAKKYVREVNPQGYTQVCIHIRRGDFNLPNNLEIGFTVVDEHYVEKAKRMFMQNDSNVFFLVVTDDKVWCKENLKNVTISPFTNPGDDMALMSVSDHVVMTSGTFGWWGAWLSGGEVVYFNEFPRPNSPLAKLFNRFDYYPQRWIGIT